MRDAILASKQLAQVHVLLVPHLWLQLHRSAQNPNRLVGAAKLRQRQAQGLHRLNRVSR